MGAALLVWLLGTGPAVAAPLSVDGSGTVLGYGRDAVLADILVPRPGDAPLAEKVEPSGRQGFDRWGRERLALKEPSGADVAERLIAAGLALVDPEAQGPALEGLLALEAEARRAGRGIWAQGDLVVQDALRVRGGVGDLVLVEGRVQKVAWAGDRLYLNFAADERRDFTLRAERAVARALARAGLDLAALAGRSVRVRGWLIQAGGPMVEVTGPAQVELLP
jgi:hypothetical protein